ncbi:MAG: hypothetical protein K5771_03110 [Oscillospiraceae bacterium]|nr:hypothetical protein [Oscillospiraceae bacterium]
MARHKAAVNCQFLLWLTAKKTNRDEGRFIQVSNSFLLSEVFHKNLSYGAQMLYLCMALEAGGQKSFKFPNSTMKKYSFPVRTARRFIEELEEQGFIKCNHALYTRQANVYEFVYDWKDREAKE